MLFSFACGPGRASDIIDVVLLDLGRGTSWDYASDTPDGVVVVGGRCTGIPSVSC